MQNNDLYIPIIFGTNRKGNKSHMVADLMLDVLKKRNIKTEIISYKDFDFEDGYYDLTDTDKNAVLRQKIKSADGYMIVSPEYNHSFPGTLKTMLDMFFNEYHGKVAGIVGVSDGPWGGVRMIEDLIPVLKVLGIFVIRKDLQFPKIDDQFDSSGNFLHSEEYNERINAFVDELVQYSGFLKNNNV